ncbi:unnamed protein product [Bursaphelenchus xylophilus]|uniref:(pine wood nematode) hypothetical protein n=1 Tax=Bursaphelenchus xylophilus TaxID=6326 RepID=A0A1I7SG00_BURXY|nr:unnamed protein product [Bursaphelenchus xylophilus]CAG9120838.1 unnamed protein product [Bursaphelenchus xylophilus]
MPSRAQRALPGTVAINRIGVLVRAVNVDQLEARGSWKKETVELISGYVLFSSGIHAIGMDTSYAHPLGCPRIRRTKSL